MSSTVSVGDYDVTSSHESAADMVESLSPKEDSAEPIVKMDAGKAPEKSPASKAAAELGRLGGEAKARAAKEKADARSADVVDDAGESTPADGGDQPDGADAPERPLGKPRHDPRARVAEATREAKEAREENERNRAALAQERTERARLTQELEAARRPAQERQERAEPQRQAAQDDDPEPKEEDYPEYKDYIKDLGKWSAESANRRLRQDEETRQSVERHYKNVDTAWGKHSDRVAAAGGDAFLAEFDPRILAAMKPTFSLRNGEMPGPINVITDEIVRSERGPDVMKFLRDNPDEFQRIATLQTPLDVAREMAKIEYRLGAATAGPSPRAEVSKARPPAQPVAGAPNTADGEPDDDASFDAHFSYHNAREARRR